MLKSPNHPLSSLTLCLLSTVDSTHFAPPAILRRQITSLPTGADQVVLAGWLAGSVTRDQAAEDVSLAWATRLLLPTRHSSSTQTKTASSTCASWPPRSHGVVVCTPPAQLKSSMHFAHHDARDCLYKEVSRGAPGAGDARRRDVQEGGNVVVLSFFVSTSLRQLLVPQVYTITFGKRHTMR
jgi:hypothetical protein